MSKVKNCPFCGGKAEGIRWQEPGVDITAVKCSNTECLASFESVELEVWNRRTTAVVSDFPQFELLMRRFCMASAGKVRDEAKQALLDFIAGKV